MCLMIGKMVSCDESLLKSVDGWCHIKYSLVKFKYNWNKLFYCTKKLMFTPVCVGNNETYFGFLVKFRVNRFNFTFFNLVLKILCTDGLYICIISSSFWHVGNSHALRTWMWNWLDCPLRNWLRLSSAELVIIVLCRIGCDCPFRNYDCPQRKWLCMEKFTFFQTP